MASHLRRFAASLAILLPPMSILSACGARGPTFPEPPSAVRRGDDAYRHGAWEAAIASYRAHLDKPYYDEYTPRVLYKTALAQYQLKRYNNAIATLEELDEEYPESKWVQVEALRGDAERELGRPVDAIRAWDRGWSLGNRAERDKLYDRLRPVIRGLNPPDLAAARRQVTSDEVADMLDRQIELRERPLFDEPMPEIPEDQAIARSRVEELEEHPRPQPRAEMPLPSASPTPEAPEPTPTAELTPETPVIPASAPAAEPAVEIAPPPRLPEHALETEEQLAETAAREPQPATDSKLEAEDEVVESAEAQPGLVRVPMLRPLSKSAPSTTTVAAAPPGEESPAAEAVPTVEPSPPPSPTPTPGRILEAAAPGSDAPVYAVAAAPEAPPGDHGQPVYARPASAAPERGMPVTPVVPGRPWGKIGCLLPLTGEGRQLGERSLDGIRLALAGAYDHLVVRDTGSDPATAVSMLSALASDPEVKVVVGPVRNDDAERAAPLAERAKLPLLLLSQVPGIEGRFVTQVAMTRTQMLAALLDYALGTARIRNVGIVYPTDTVGQDMLVSVRREVERRGGTVVGTFGYSAATRSQVTEVIRRWRDERHAQGIFLPDSVAAAEGVARFMHQEMPDVTLLGVHNWEGLAGRPESGGEGVTGVLFADTFFPASPHPGTRRFVESFEKVYGRAPGTVEAQAYDAALLAKHALSSGARERIDVQQDLHAIGPIDGAAGDLMVTADGLQRRLFLVRVTDGELTEVGSR